VWLAEGNDVGAGELPSNLPVTIVPTGDVALPVLSELALLCLADGPECPSLGLASAAMAAGRPVVAARVPGMDELVDDGATGAVVPADPDALAAAALGLLENRGRLRTLGQAARTRAERVLGVDGMARAIAALYEASILGAVSGPAGAESR
jgi:glycosyltransferase involved in cell wall biosynthesis